MLHFALKIAAVDVNSPRELREAAIQRLIEEREAELQALRRRLADEESESRASLSPAVAEGRLTGDAIASPVRRRFKHLAQTGAPARPRIAIWRARSTLHF